MREVKPAKLALFLLLLVFSAPSSRAQESAQVPQPSGCALAVPQRPASYSPEVTLGRPAADDRASVSPPYVSRQCQPPSLETFDPLERSIREAQPGALATDPGDSCPDEEHQTQGQEKPPVQSGSSPDNPPDAQQPGAKPGENADTLPQQPKRILGVMPNFRAVSAGTHPPPPTPKQSFVLATQNSFDYSSFIFVGFTSAVAEWTNAHEDLGQGMPGFGRYYWRGFLDKTDGNYWVLFILPTMFHQDERYYALGKGGFWKRFGYAASRVIITPNYQGHDTFNISELMGRGISQAISVSYYPPSAHTVGAIASKFGYAVFRDALTQVFREFWPDIDKHVLHRHQ